MQIANIMGSNIGAQRYVIGGPVDFPVHALDNAAYNGGRLAATPEVCNRIICGFISQAQAGPDLLYACSQTGHVGARAGCADPVCRSISYGDCPSPVVTEPRPEYIQPPTANPLPFIMPEPTQIVDPGALTPPMPTITPMRRPVAPVAMTNDCGLAGWLDENKLLALAGLLAVVVVMRS